MKSMIDKTVGVYMDRKSASSVTVIVGFYSDGNGERVSMEYGEKKILVPYYVIEDLASQVREM